MQRVAAVVFMTALPEGAKISYDYINAMTPVIEQQLLLGGLRLAALLNELYQ